MDANKNFEDFLLFILRNSLNDMDIIEPTSLQTAVKNNNLTLTKLLINNGCNIDVVDEDGNNLLMLASTNPSYGIIYALLDANASVLLTNKHGQCAAEMLIRIVDFTIGSLLYQLLRKIKEECSNNSQLTAETLLRMKCRLPQAVVLRDTTVTKYMIDNGCNVNERLDDDNITALHAAVFHSDIENVKLLINCGADINAKAVHIFGTTPIDCLDGERDESAEILNLLVDQGASLLDNNGNFRKGDYLESGCKKLIETLLQLYSLDLNKKDKTGTYLLYYLCGNKCFDPIEVLQEQHLDIEIFRNSENNPLMNAVFRGNYRTAEFLLINGVEVDTIFRGETGLFTALYPISRMGYRKGLNLKLKCVEILLQNGANAQFKEEGGETVIDYILKTKKFMFAKPILAHLAMIKSLGAKIENYIANQINSHNFFKYYFHSCKQKIEEMKNKVLSRSVTLFEFLTINEEKIIYYARNKELVSRLKIIVYSTRRSNLYYYIILRKRVAKLVEYANLRNEALDVLSHIQGLKNNRIILIKIVDFFNYGDLQKLAQV